MRKERDRFIKTYHQGSFANDVEILVDRVTGVNYLWITEGKAGGLTPLLDQNGKPVVTAIPTCE